MVNNEWKFVRIALGILISLAALFALAGSIYAFKSVKYIGSAPATNTIPVSGHGEAFAVPNIAEVTFSVEKSASTVAVAQKQVTDLMNDVLATLKSSGIAEKDLQTTGYNIYPKYEYQTTKCSVTNCYPQGKDVLVGYTVSNSVTVKIRNLDKAGDILATLGGKNVTNLSGLNFTLEDDNAPKSEARTEAITKAKQQADTLANQLGVHLVRIVSFNENGNYPIYYSKVANQALDARTETSAGAAPAIQTGENKITSDVTITYEIQ
jgi:uncharacterized protein YggE